MYVGLIWNSPNCLVFLILSLAIVPKFGKQVTGSGCVGENLFFQVFSFAQSLLHNPHFLKGINLMATIRPYFGMWLSFWILKSQLLFEIYVLYSVFLVKLWNPIRLKVYNESDLWKFYVSWLIFFLYISVLKSLFTSIFSNAIWFLSFSFGCEGLYLFTYLFIYLF